MTLDEARARSLTWRLAHIARLIRSLAMHYGIDTDCATPELTDRLDCHSPAAVLHELEQISQLAANRASPSSNVAASRTRAGSTSSSSSSPPRAG